MAVKGNYEQFNQENLSKIVSRFGASKELRILYISTYIPNYTRTETLLELMRKNEIEVTEILTGDSKLKYFRAIYGLIRCQKDCDLVFVAFRGHEILPLLRLVTRKPIIFDAFISVYDTLCFDRKIFKPSSLAGRFLKWYDRFLCGISNVVLVETKTHKEFFEKEFEADNVDYIYVGCNKDLFRPLEIKKDRSEFVVFWYGYANPLQGVDIILRAAKLLEDEKVSFRLAGPIRKKYPQLVEELQLTNVEFVDFIPYQKLPVEINRADVCLGGHFSDRAKAARTIAGKTYQFLACEKPTIVGDNPANRELFEDGGLIEFVKMNNADDLASKILEIKRR